MTPKDTAAKDDDADRVPDDAGTDADVDPGLVVPAPDESSTSDASKADENSSTNHTGLTPDSIPVD